MNRPRRDHHAEQRHGRQADRELVDAAGQGSADEDPERDRSEDERREGDDEAAQLLAAALAVRRLVGGPGDREQAGGPALVEPAAGLVGALRGLDEVHGVGDPEEPDPDEQQRPGAVQAPAAAGEQADGGGHEHEVEDRIGEADQDRDGVAVEVRGDGAEDERGRAGGDGAGGDQAVDPEAAALVAAVAGEDDDAADGQRREEQVAGVGGGGERRARVGPEDARVVELAEAPGGHAGGEQRPAEPALAPRDRSPGAQAGRDHEHGVVHGPGAEGGGRSAEGEAELLREQPRGGEGEEDGDRRRASNGHGGVIGSRPRGP